LEQLKESALREPLEAGDEERMNRFKELVMLQSIEEEGCLHLLGLAPAGYLAAPDNGA
jgi:hypothetical protein